MSRRLEEQRQPEPKADEHRHPLHQADNGEQDGRNDVGKVVPKTLRDPDAGWQIFLVILDDKEFLVGEFLGVSWKQPAKCGGSTLPTTTRRVNNVTCDAHLPTIIRFGRPYRQRPTKSVI